MKNLTEHIYQKCNRIHKECDIDIPFEGIGWEMDCVYRVEYFVIEDVLTERT